jgi:hypothetical protein
MNTAKADHCQLVFQLLKQLAPATLAPGLLALGCLGDDLQFVEIAHCTLLKCERHARYSAMLLSDGGQLLPEKDFKSGV